MNSSPQTPTGQTARHFIGLMSGTSLDGVDAVLMRQPMSDNSPTSSRMTLVDHHFIAMPYGLRQELLALQSPQDNEIHRSQIASQALVECYVQAIAALLQKTNTDPALIAAIGAHGQTIRHQPASGYSIQINAPHALAEATGITVISDFRQRDIAAGGQGAPLVPVFHASIFNTARQKGGCIIANIGGMANLTYLPPPGSEARVIGFDCGPGNVLMDAWVEAHTGERFDRDGQFAANGQKSDALLNQLLSHDFFAQKPPKSCGREQFNLAWLQEQVAPFHLSPENVQATLLAFTARTLADAVRHYCGPAVELLVCGGGAHNPQLMQTLATALPELQVDTTARYDMNPSIIEAAAFAWLAQRTLDGLPGNLSAVTGAAGPRILGNITPA
ncbi:MAG: anhydro-N-acetylmuramic acid kinase [Fluviibacter sp.]